ncbi:MAG TPA: glycosyltransferase family 1 protein [Rhodocyclaceae bacterium]|nr:glycosyltransferase family 1 protein [Rhodocyclaceae bacterium]
MDRERPSALTTAPGRLRVALVTETFPPEVNGVAMTLGRLTEGLRSRGHDVEVVRPRQSADVPGTPHEITVPGLPIPNYRGLRFGLPARGLLLGRWTENPPDIVHVATEGPLGASAIAAARKLGLPVSSSFHTNFDAYCRHYGLGWLKQPIAGYLCRFHNRCDVTYVPTRALARELGDFGYRDVSILSRGVDTRLFNPARRCEALRASWGAQPNDLVVAYVGRIAAEKNLKTVVDAFAAIRSQQPQAKLVFVGDGPLRKMLTARHPEHIFTGMRHGADLAAHYASSDIFLFPSLTETFGNAVTEALASGLGVVAYAQAAAAELIRDGSNGLLAAPGNSEAFIAAAARLAQAPYLLAMNRRHAATSVAELDWEHIHAAFAAALIQLVNARGGRQHGQDRLAVAQE